MVRSLTPIPPGGKNRVGYHGPGRTVDIGNADRVGAGIHVNRRRTVVIHRHGRSAIIPAPWLTIGNHLGIIAAVAEGEAVAGIGDIQTGAAGAIEVDGLRGGNGTNPRHDERNQGCFHRTG